MNNDLLPPSASTFMRNAAAASQILTAMAVDLNTLWDTEKCPVDLLPFLAWTLSVDHWDKRWSEQTKRQVIKSAWLIHRQKGTIAALRRVVEPFGYFLHVIEWWQTGGVPGTFRLDIGVQDNGITEETFFEIERLIADAKPPSRHLLGLNITLDTQGVAYVAANVYDGDELTVYPYFPETITVFSSDCTGAGIHVIDTMSVTV